jgi:dTDP-L-rhamnose 4-epimerase
MARILVTGGAGFIGSHLVDALLAAGHGVRVLDALDPQVHGGLRERGEWPSYLAKECEKVVGDVRDRDALRRALDGIEVLYHQASAVGVGQSMYEIERYVDANTRGTAVLLDVLANEPHTVRKLIVASSMSIYGEGAYRCPTHGAVYPQLRPESQLDARSWEMQCPLCGEAVAPLPTTEEKPLYPTSIYAITKRDQEEMCLVVGRAYGIPTVALRYFNVYGPRQALSNPYTGVAAIFSGRLLNDQPPLIYEDGQQSRDFTHVSDIVQANMLALERDEIAYGAYNVVLATFVTATRTLGGSRRSATVPRCVLRRAWPSSQSGCAPSRRRTRSRKRAVS